MSVLLGTRCNDFDSNLRSSGRSGASNTCNRGAGDQCLPGVSALPPLFDQSPQTLRITDQTLVFDNIAELPSLTEPERQSLKTPIFNVRFGSTSVIGRCPVRAICGRRQFADGKCRRPMKRVAL